MQRIKKVCELMLMDWKLAIMVGFLLRLVLIPFSFNWDTWANTQVAAHLHTGTLTEVYKDPRSAYPPLMYWWLFSLIKVTMPFMGNGFWEWAKTGSLVGITDVHIFRYLFWLKLPVILADIGLGVVLLKLVEGKKGLKVLWAWMVNPVTLYLVPVFTNVDIWPMLTMGMCWLLVKNRRWSMGALMLGAGVALKLFPIFLVPYLVALPDKWWQRVKLGVIAAGPVVLSLVGAWKNPVVWERVLGGGGNSQIIFFAAEDIGISRYVKLFVVIWAFLLIRFLGLKAKQREKEFANYMAYVFIPVFVVSVFHIQWMLWVWPLMVLTWVKWTQTRWPIVVIVGMYLLLVAVGDPSMHVGMLAPVDITFWKMPNPLSRFRELENLAQSVMAGGMVWWGYFLSKQKRRLWRES